MHAIWALYCHKPCPSFGLSAWIVVFAGMQLLLSQARRAAAHLTLFLPPLSTCWESVVSAMTFMAAGNRGQKAR
jgi:hypothetical protein